MSRTAVIAKTLTPELLPVIRLAEWARTRTSDDFCSLVAPPPGVAQKWLPDLLPPELVTSIRQAPAQRQPIALRVPMFVELRAGGPQQTSFDIFLEHSQEESEKPVFIRDELIISDVKSPRISEVRSLVIVEDPALAGLLRDAETPAHTQWNTGTSKFKDKYKFGPGAIRFVSFSVSELLRIINQAEQQPDPTITIDFFSVPAPSGEEDALPGQSRKPRQVPGDGPSPPLPSLPPRLRRFRIDRLRGGFTVRAGHPDAALPPFIDIRVAYDIRRGNPLRKYNQADFDLGSSPIRFDSRLSGVEVKKARGNEMLVAVERAGFNLDVTGFDPDRDLYVKAEVKEIVDVD
jgi:hypothetical protein